LTQHLSIPLFLAFRWNSALDILLVAILIYQLYKLTKGTVAIRIFVGIIAIYLVWKLVVAFQMEMLGEILGQFIQAGVIVLIIVFQQEIRRFLLLIGNTELLQGKGASGWLGKLMGNTKKEETDISSIIYAIRNMAATQTGALIVLGQKSDPLLYCSSSEAMESKISSRIIESIFYKNSPLHDGAIIIHNNRIQAVRAVLPVTESPEFPADLGMRHRSAVGITEPSDAIAITVSEQNGQVAFAYEGKLERNVNIDALEKRLHKLMNTE